MRKNRITQALHTWWDKHLVSPWFLYWYSSGNRFTGLNILQWCCASLLYILTALVYSSIAAFSRKKIQDLTFWLALIFLSSLSFVNLGSIDRGLWTNNPVLHIVSKCDWLYHVPDNTREQQLLPLLMSETICPKISGKTDVFQNSKLFQSNENCGEYFQCYPNRETVWNITSKFQVIHACCSFINRRRCMSFWRADKNFCPTVQYSEPYFP